MSNNTKELYEFGPFQLDPEKRLLLRDHQPIPLQLKAFETLLALVRHGDQVVLKEDLMQAVWPDTFVEEGNLAQSIFVLRKTLGPMDGDQRYIATIPGRGYRLAVKVRVVCVERDGAAASLAEGAAAESANAVPKPAVVAEARPSPIIRRALVTCVSLLVLALVFLFLRPAVPAPRVTRIRQITHLGTVVHNTRLVSDGPRIYFRAWQGKERVLRAVSTEGGQVISVDNPIAAFDIDDISSGGSEFLETDLEDLRRLPDSQGLYASLWRVPVPSGSPRPAGTLRASDAAWAPDGRTIAYSLASSLYRANLDGTDAHRIAKLPDDPFYLAWSPDGKRLRFTVADSAHAAHAIWQADLSTDTVRPWIQDLPHAAYPWAGGWTPDQNYFLYSALNDGTRNIWAIREKREFWRRVNPQPVQLTNGPLNFYLPLPAKDSKHVFAVGEQLRGQLESYAVKTQQFLDFAGGLSADSVAYSHDGKWMAYVEFPEGNLVRSRADGSDRRQLTFPPMRAFTPQWSPNDRQIAFQASTQAGAPSKIFLISRDGGAPALAGPPSPDRQRYPSWTSDGSAILFSSANDSESQSELHLLDLNTQTTSVLPQSTGLEWAQLSPDGQRVAAVRKFSGELVLYDCVSHTTQALAKKAAYPRWSNDGKYLYFDSPYFDVEGITGGVYRWERATQTTQLLVKYPEFLLTGVFGVSYGITPEGAILLLRDTTSRDLYALDLDLP
jgi:DNA-binding winged helix-turn-helix (wHTH) protein/Tol biopolymer transport system component